jgi:hypothetical protein
MDCQKIMQYIKQKHTYSTNLSIKHSKKKVNYNDAFVTTYMKGKLNSFLNDKKKIIF